MSSEGIKEPKDLGLKVGTPEEVFWTGIKTGCEETISKCRHEITIQEHLIKLAEEKIKEEKPKGLNKS